eukprot:gene5683-6567_t
MHHNYNFLARNATDVQNIQKFLPKMTIDNRGTVPLPEPSIPSKSSSGIFSKVTNKLTQLKDFISPPKKDTTLYELVTRFNSHVSVNSDTATDIFETIDTIAPHSSDIQLKSSEILNTLVKSNKSPQLSLALLMKIDCTLEHGIKNKYQYFSEMFKPRVKLEPEHVVFTKVMLDFVRSNMRSEGTDNQMVNIITQIAMACIDNIGDHNIYQEVFEGLMQYAHQHKQFDDDNIYNYYKRMNSCASFLIMFASHYGLIGPKDPIEQDYIRYSVIFMDFLSRKCPSELYYRLKELNPDQYPIIKLQFLLQVYRVLNNFELERKVLETMFQRFPNDFTTALINSPQGMRDIGNRMADFLFKIVKSHKSTSMLIGFLEDEELFHFFEPSLTNSKWLIQLEGCVPNIATEIFGLKTDSRALTLLRIHLKKKMTPQTFISLLLTNPDTPLDVKNFKQVLYGLYQDYQESFSGDSLAFTHVANVLKGFDCQLNASPLHLVQSFDEKKKRYNDLTFCASYLRDFFGFKIDQTGSPRNIPEYTEAIDSLETSIIRGKGKDGHVIKSDESIKFISYFKSMTHNQYFHLIVKYYTNTNNHTNSIDTICQQSSRFMRDLIEMNQQMEVVEIFNDIVNGDGRKSSSKDELESIEIQSLCDAAKDNNLLFADSQSILDNIKSLIGGLGYQHLSIFDHVHGELVQFMASFGSKSNFDQKNSVITSNLISDVYNSNLLNNVIFTYNLLEPFIRYLQDPKSCQFKSLADFCADVGRVILRRDDLDACLKKLTNVNDSLSQIRGLYSTALGTYSTESILPTVSQLLDASEFQTRTSKFESRLAGWGVTLISNGVAGLEFTQESIQDFAQGLSFIKSQVTKNEHMVKIKQYCQLVTLLKDIHSLHVDLDRAYHPEYFQGILRIKIVRGDLDSLGAACNQLRQDLRDWTDSIKQLPCQLWLLRAQPLSSLISAHTQLTAQLGARQTLDPNRLAVMLAPYIKYCFPDVTQAIVLSILKANPELLTNLHYIDFLNLLVEKVIEMEHQDVFGDTSAGAGPILVVLEHEHSLFNTMMQLNNSLIPHPSQVFYASDFDNDFSYFTTLAEGTKGTLFLVGHPANKDQLVQWLSEHYSNQTLKDLAQIYIISVDSQEGSYLNFVCSYNEPISTDWKPFKNLWMSHHSNSAGISSLNLVYGESSSGKSYYIRQAIATKPHITVHISPSFEARLLIEKVQEAIGKGLQSMAIHFIVSPYVDHSFFSHLIYSLVVSGFIMGTRVGELVSIGGHIKLDLFVEIGSPITVDQLAIVPSLKDHINRVLPLVFYLSTHLQHSGMPWEMKDAEKECYKIVGGDYNRMFRTIRDNIVQQEPGYNPSYLVSGQHLQQVRNFLSLFHERLKFLVPYTAYYNYVAQAYPAGLREILPVERLRLELLLESVKLADPIYSSAQTFWANPPMVTSRVHIEEDKIAGEFCNKVQIDYIDFGVNPKLSNQVSTLFTSAIARDRPKEFLGVIGHTFGITSRTYLVNDLCQQYGFAMTSDFALKILLLHNKVKNQRSLVLQGDTGVGKTFILLFYSLLVNAHNNTMPDILDDLREAVNEHIRVYGLRSPKLPGGASPAALVTSLLELDNQAPASSAFKGLQSTEQATHRAKLYQMIETRLRKMLKKYPLIDVPVNSILATIIANNNNSITSKDTMIDAVKQICSVSFRNTFHRVIMHQRYTAKEFTLEVNKFIKESVALRTIDPALKMVVFVDEFNTAPKETLALISEIFVDGRLDGQLIIPDNIFFVGAMNPLVTAHGVLDFTGTTTITSNKAFVVEPPPPSMNALLFNYGDFNETHERSFLQSLLNLKSEITRHPDDLLEFVTMAQIALRAAKEPRVHVSIRDITRAIDIYRYFIEDPSGKAILACAYPQANAYTFHWLALISSVALTYYVRVSIDRRRDMMNRFSTHLTNKIARNNGINIAVHDFKTMFKSIYSKFVSKEYTTLPDGIALTESLQLNIFLTVVSINCCQPLCIVGPPGCSKTLSFSIVVDNMNQQNKSASKSPWSLMPNTDPFRYQCTQHTTDIEIKNKFEQALNRQANYHESGGKTRCVVFLDEAGLVQENDSPMKIMHDYLDKVSIKLRHTKVDIAIVILSNRILDAAKTNRTIVLVHPEQITSDDEKALVLGVLFNNDLKPDAHHESMASALCQAYKQVNRHTLSTKANLFHQRDFVYFLRHLARSMQLRGDRSVLHGVDLLAAIERNFGGIPNNDLGRLTHEFFGRLERHQFFKSGDVDEQRYRDNTIQRIEESLGEVCNVADNPNTSAFRYMMLIDPTDNETALHMLRELDLKRDLTIIRVGGFTGDTTNEALVKVVSQIKNAMYQGGTVVLVNTGLISACFYEVFNRYFTRMPKQDGGEEYIAMVSFGTHSIYCPVHPNFRIIVHMPLSNLAQTQLPWLNRFEKYRLSLDNMIEHLGEHDKNLLSRCESLIKSAKHFTDTFHTTGSNNLLFSGLSNDTVPSLVYSMLKKSLGTQVTTPLNISPIRVNDHQKNQVQPLERLLNWKLLQIARPETLYSCKNLPSEYMEEYLMRQEHFNVLRFLHHLFQRRLVHNDTNVSNKWFIFTRTSLTLHHLRQENESTAFAKILTDNLGTETLRIVQLASFNSSESCAEEINSFKSSFTQRICLAIADMSIVNQHQINYFIELVTRVDPSKFIVIVAHYPAEFCLSNLSKINAIFLNDLDYAYIDSIGVNIDQTLEHSTSMDEDIRTWIAKAYGLHPVELDNLSIEKTFREMFESHLTLIASSMQCTILPQLLNSLPLSERQFYSNKTDRRKVLLDIFDRHPVWYKQLVTSFTNQWEQKDLFSKIVRHISSMILTGKLVQSYIDAIKSSLTSFFYPVIANTIKMLTNYQSLSGINNIQPGSSEEEMVRLMIGCIKMPKIGASVEQRYEPITIAAAPSPDIRGQSGFLLYDTLSSTIDGLFSRVLNRPDQSTDARVLYASLIEQVNNHPIAQLIKHIDQDQDLNSKYRVDFILRTIRLNARWLQFAQLLVHALIPLRNTSILMLTVINYKHLDTILFLKNMVSPLVNLSESNVDDILGQFTQEFGSLSDTDTGSIRKTIATKSVSILHSHLSNVASYPDDLIQPLIANWCSVVREQFNMTPISVIMKTLAIERGLAKLTGHAIHIHTLYQLFIHVSLTVQDTSILKTINIIWSVFAKQTTTELKVILANIHKLNEELHAADLKPIAIDCILEIIEPILFQSQDNITTYLALADHSLKLLPYPFVNHIPVGWHCYIINNRFVTDGIDEIRLIFEKMIVNPGRVTNPALVCSSQTTSEVLIRFFKMTKTQFNDAPSNSNLINILYFALLEYHTVRSSTKDSIQNNYLLNQFNRLLPKQFNLFDQIELYCIGTLLLNKLADLIMEGNFAATERVLKEQPYFTRHLVSLLETDKPLHQSPLDVMNNRINQVHLLNKISSEKILVQFLQHRNLTTLLGVPDLFIAESIAIKDLSVLPFVIDSSTADGILFSQLLSAIVSRSTPEIEVITTRVANSPREQSLVRMSLFLISYQFYIEKKPMDFLQSIIANGSSFIHRLGLTPYINIFAKVMHGRFNPAVKHFDAILIADDTKSQDNRIIAQLLVNIAACSIGSSNRCYLYHLTASPEVVAGKTFPANEGALKDCGMIYRTNNNETPNTISMGGNVLHKFMITSTTWGALAWSASTCSATTHQLIRASGMINTLNDPSQIGLADYISQRSITSITELSMSKLMRDEHKEPGLFLSELLYNLWSDSYLPNYQQVASFVNRQQLLSCETYLTKSITTIWNDSARLKALRIQQRDSNVLTMVQALRQEYTKNFTTPFYSFDAIHDLATKQPEHKLLSFFTTHHNKIELASQIPTLIHFIKVVHAHFVRRLPESYLNRSVRDAIDYMVESNLESDAIDTIESSWTALKNSWQIIQKHLAIMEGGCEVRANFERQVPSIQDDTLLSQLIHSGPYNNGCLLDVIDDWLETVQAHSLALKTDIKCTPFFQEIIEGFDNNEHTDRDLAAIPYEFGENYLLVGSNFRSDNFLRFLYRCLSHYQCFERQSFAPDIDTIEHKLIYQYLSGKLSNIRQLVRFKKEFPFVRESKVSSKPHDSLSLLITDSIKELISLVDKMDDGLYNNKIPEQTLVPLSVQFKSKLRPDDLERVCQFLVANISRILNMDPEEEENLRLQAPSIIEFTRRPKDDLPVPIRHRLEYTPLNSIKLIAKVFIEGYLGFGYLYSSVIHEPVQPNLAYVKHFNDLKISIQEDANLPHQQEKWIEYLKQMVERSTKYNHHVTSKKFITLLPLFQEFMNGTESPTDLINAHEHFVPKDLPIEYYPLFMRCIHETLSTLYIKSQDVSLTPYQELFGDLRDSNGSYDNLVTSIQEVIMNDQDDAIDVDNQEEEDDMDIITVSDDSDSDSSDSDEDMVDKPSIPISPVSCHPFVHCLFNWLRFKPESILFSNTSSTHRPLIKLFQDFLEECQYHNKKLQPINIENIYSELIKLINVERISQPGDLLIQILECLTVDSKSKKLFTITTKLKLAACTHGFVGADLRHLCNEAALGHIKASTSKEMASKELVTLQHFEASLEYVRPAILSDYSMTFERIDFDDIGGLDDVIRQVKSCVLAPIFDGSNISRLGIAPPSGVLLHGPPGTGKSLIARAIASSAATINFLAVQSTDIISPVVGESEKRLASLFGVARDAAPCILFLDQVEVLAKQRGYDTSTEQSADRLLSCLLVEMDGVYSSSSRQTGGVLILAATTRIDLLDATILRPGRFDYHILFPSPDQAGRQDILKKITKSMPIGDSVDFQQLAAKTNNLNGADLNNLCKEAALVALRLDLDSKQISMNDFIEVLNK